MKSANFALKPICRLTATLAILVGQTGVAPVAQGNVFASNVRLADAATNLMTIPGDSVSISYLLNQHADAGVAVAVVSGETVLWATNLTSTGTNQGLNSVVWNGRDLSGNVASNGLWHVRVQPASAGFTKWTRIRIAHNGGTPSGDGYVWGPQGIAVNNNTNSLYFGRVFVGNAEAAAGSAPGDKVGIAKYNADGTDAAEGAYSTGTFAEGSSLPGKIEVGLDDRVYVVDGMSDCRVLSFDQLISTNPAPLQVLTASNLTGGASYNGLAVAGSGTNRQIYLSDATGVSGVRCWNMPSGTVSPTDLGAVAVASGGLLDLNYAPQDVALDSNEKVYPVQYITGFDYSPRVLGYPAYQGTTITNALWTYSTFSLIRAGGIAAALHTNFLAAVCEEDYGDAISIFNRIDGSLIETDGLNNFDGYTHSYTDTTWDLAGNLYVTDYDAGAWRVFSPPGSNSFALTSLQSLKIGNYIQPTLLSAHWQTNQCQIQLAGEPGVGYAIETSTNLVTWFSVVTNTALSITNTWAIPASLPEAFFRARVVKQTY